MSSIYELTKSQRELMNLVESGELSETDAADTFECMESELNDKINDYNYVLRSMTLHLENIDSELDRLATLKKEKTNQIANVKERLISGLNTIGRTKFDTGLFKGSVRKGRASVDIKNPSLVPVEYIETKAVESINKTEIKKSFDAGIPVAGCEIKIGKPSLVIK